MDLILFSVIKVLQPLTIIIDYTANIFLCGLSINFELLFFLGR